MKYTFFTLSALFLAFFASAQPAIDKSVVLSATVQEDPASITLEWIPAPDATQYQIFRRMPGQANWGFFIATVTPPESSFTDTDVLVGQSYEYRVFKASSTNNGFGYITAGIRVPAIDQKGKVILVVDNTHADALAPEIARLVDDLIHEGWLVEQLEVSPDDPVTAVKNQILDLYDQDPVQTRSVLLLGRVPVPYSGNIFPDGHPDHQGAWPADVYYAEVNGVWTDNSVNNTVASDSRNDNVPGDGKFDQSFLSSDVDLEIGRVDFAKLSAFSAGEESLLRQYLDKNHAFRTRAFVPVRRGLLEDNFASMPEGFSQNGWKNFSALMGKDSVSAQDYRATLQAESYLWSYGCGAGSYTSCGGVTNTTNYTNDSLQTVFTMLFGSYFGDWDSNNNLLRAALASGQTLTNAWAGRPHWQFHPMGLGETIGFCTRLSQNNGGVDYEGGFYTRSVHVALMGDPTLVMLPAEGLNTLAVTEENGHAVLNWTMGDPPSEGFYVYRRTNASDFFARLTEEPIVANAWVDSCLTAGVTYEYMVRAVHLETTGSGTFYNLSPGMRASVTITSEAPAPVAYFEWDMAISAPFVMFQNFSEHAQSYLWNFGDGETSTESDPTHAYPEEGIYPVTLIAYGDCGNDTLTLEVEVLGSSSADLQEKTGFSIHPNPADAGWWVVFEKEGMHVLYLYDLQGRLLQTQSGNSQKTWLPATHLLSGWYLVKAIQNESTGTQVLIKE